jgi:transposase InsO family protein
MSLELVADVLTMALWGHRPPPGLLHHRDRSSESAYARYQQMLEQHGLNPSMSRTGNCLDNSAVERFFGSLKRDCTLRR